MDAAAATGQTKPHAWGRGWRWAAPGEGALDWVRGRATGPLTRLIGGIGRTGLSVILPRGTGEGDRRRRWRGRQEAPVFGVAPSTSFAGPPPPLRGGGSPRGQWDAGPANYLVLHIPCRGSFVMDISR